MGEGVSKKKWRSDFPPQGRAKWTTPTVRREAAAQGLLNADQRSSGHLMRPGRTKHTHTLELKTFTSAHFELAGRARSGRVCPP